MGLTNAYVEKLCKKILKHHTFLGVYPCDIHPKFDKRRNFSVVFNTGDSTTSGYHFVCIYVNKKTLFYFDSFGDDISLDPNIKRFTENFPNKCLCQNTQKIQHNLSQFCGFYCIAYLLSKDLNIPEDIFKSQFNEKNLLENDKNVIYFIKKYIKNQNHKKNKRK